MINNARTTLMLLIFIAINIVSCSQKYKIEPACKSKLMYIKSKLIPIKGEKYRIWKFQFDSTDNKAQHEEFRKLAYGILGGQLDCLIGLDKNTIIKYLGQPSNNYVQTNQTALMYFIRFNYKCGLDIPDEGNLSLGSTMYCNALEFSFENDKINSIALDLSELGW